MATLSGPEFGTRSLAVVAALEAGFLVVEAGKVVLSSSGRRLRWVLQGFEDGEQAKLRREVEEKLARMVVATFGHDAVDGFVKAAAQERRREIQSAAAALAQVVDRNERDEARGKVVE